MTPLPVPGHVVLWAREINLELALPNAELPQVTQERAGGWKIIPVPQLRPLVAFEAHPEVRVQLVGAFDAWAQRGTVARRLTDLRKLGNKVSSDIRRPPLIRLIGRVPSATVGANADWVLDGLEVVEELHVNGVVSRARCTVTLLQWSTSTITERRAPARTYTWRKGDTLSAVAKRMLGSAGKHTEIRKANPKIKTWSKVRVGAKIKVPAR